MTITIQLPSGNCVACQRDTILIGRDANCDVCLPNEASLQPQHAKIRNIAGRWLIESQGDWAIRVESSVPGRTAWLGPGNRIQLAPGGPTVVFQPPSKDLPRTTPTTKGQGTDSDPRELLIAKRGERDALKTATLPQLYQQLGNHLIDSRKYESEFPAFHRRFDALKEKLTELRKAQAGHGEAADEPDEPSLRLARKPSLSKQPPCLASWGNRRSQNSGVGLAHPI